MNGCEAYLLIAERVASGEATEAERRALELHAASCAACATAGREQDALSRLVREAMPRPMRPAFRDAVLGWLAAERRRERFWVDADRFARRWLRVAAAAAVIIGLSAVALIARNGVSAPQVADAQATAEDFLESPAPVTVEVAAELALGGEPQD